MKIRKLIHGDCFDIIPSFANRSIDMIFADLPYGTTECDWDKKYSLAKLWKEYKRIIKDNGTIVLSASQPFTTWLINSNLQMFKYEWIWVKNTCTGFINARNAPLKAHENILVFSKGKTANCNKNNMFYFPQGIRKINKFTKSINSDKDIWKKRPCRDNQGFISEFTGYPKSVLFFNSEKSGFHSTQKPVSLIEYLVKTYTREGDLVLDSHAGAFTTAIACDNISRQWICIEKEKFFCELAEERISKNKIRLQNQLSNIFNLFHKK